MEDNLIKRFMTSIKCSVCGQHYEVDNVKIISHQEGLWFLRVACSTCCTQCLVAAVLKEGRAPEVITDLTAAELGKFRKMGRLTADEVLDMHNFLKDFDGDFSHLFSQK